jgi:hypothetical protein
MPKRAAPSLKIHARKNAAPAFQSVVSPEIGEPRGRVLSHRVRIHQMLFEHAHETASRAMRSRSFDERMMVAVYGGHAQQTSGADSAGRFAGKCERKLRKRVVVASPAGVG